MEQGGEPAANGGQLHAFGSSVSLSTPELEQDGGKLKSTEQVSSRALMDLLAFQTSRQMEAPC